MILSGVPLYGRFLAQPTKISLVWKGQSGMNTLAYYGHLYITDVKSFIILGPGSWPGQLGRPPCGQSYKSFFLVIDDRV
jgi:hypothetical protein